LAIQRAQQCDGEEQDLIANGGFEEDTSWYAIFTAGFVGYDSAIAHTGARSGIMSGDANADMWMGQEIEFPPQVSEASFVFDVHQDINDSNDELYVIFYDEDVIDILVWGYVDLTTSGSWQSRGFDLTPQLESLAGRTVNVMFYAVTDEINHTVYHIDDVNLMACVPPPWCTEVLSNGDVETGSLTPWQVDGNVSLVTGGVPSGDYAILIGGGASGRVSRHPEANNVAPLAEEAESSRMQRWHSFSGESRPTGGLLSESVFEPYPGADGASDQSMDVAPMQVATGTISALWQTFTFSSEGRSLALDFWIGAEESPDPLDEIYVWIVTSDLSQAVWGKDLSLYYRAGYWEPVSFKIAADPTWAGQEFALLFTLQNDGLDPESVFWLDAISLGTCPESPHVTNSYLRADVGADNNLFVIGTTGGDPATTNDDDKNLLYGFEPDGYSSPWSSFSTLRVISGTVPFTETVDYSLDLIAPVQPPASDGNAVVAAWWIDGFWVIQQLSLAENPYTDRADTVLIEYWVWNWNADTRAAGVRTMLDVKVGGNDGAPYFVPGYGDIVHETEFIGENVPPYWKAFESPDFDPNYLKSQGVLQGEGAVSPDRLVIGQWLPLWFSRWDYTISATEVVTGDSAVAMYWNPVELYYGEIAYFATYYGLAGAGGGSTWLDAPADVTCDDLEFEVVLWAVNDTSAPLTDGQSTLTLPSGLSLVPGESRTKSRATIAPGEAQAVSWWVFASGNAAATPSIAATTSFAGGGTLTPSPLQINIPRCEAASLEPPSGLEANPGHRTIALSWDPSTSPGVEGYNVYRSSTSATGPFTQINTAPVATTSYLDADPALITGTTYYYGVTSLAGGSESQRSSIASATLGQLVLFIADTYGSRGMTTTLPVNIANANGLQIGSQDIWVTYPTQTLQLMPNGVRRTALSMDYAFAINEDPTGTLRIALATGSTDNPSLYGEGTLFHLLFDVVGVDGTSGDLVFDRSETEIYASSDLINPVALSLEDGMFSVQRNFMLGDLSDDGRVKSNDAALALRIAVGRNKPTEEQRNSGDVNGDRRINSADVALIIRMVVGLNPLPSGQRLAVLQALPESPVTLSVDEVSGAAGGTVWVPVRVDDAAQVAGVDLTLNYDPSVLEFEGARLAGLTKNTNFGIESHVDTEGIAHISLAQYQDQTHQGLSSGSGPLFEVGFTIKRRAQDVAAPLTLSSVHLNDAYGRDFATSALQKPVRVSNGRVTVGQVGGIYLPILLRNQ
jgi:hypothetical protein